MPGVRHKACTQHSVDHTIGTRIGGGGMVEGRLMNGLDHPEWADMFGT